MTGREAALQVLTACRKLDAWSDGSLKAAVRGMEKREAAFASRLTYGVLQNRVLLDDCLGRCCTQSFEKMEPFLRDVLRIGAYQILFMDRVPDHAAVSQAVEMVKTHRRQRSAGFINAVLRKVSREKEQLLHRARTEGGLALRYSHPQWLVDRLLAVLGTEETEAFLAMNNSAAPTAIQRNPLKCSGEELVERLTGEECTLEPHRWLADCWLLTGSGDLESSPAFQEGWFQVQDPAAKAAVLAADPVSGMRVLDVCAAPGGKTFAAAMAMGDQGRITACDIHRHKLELIEKSAQRLGVTNVETVLADGRQNREEWNGSFDLVICDVPCSGLGIIRKKPDIRYKDPAALAGLPGVQRAILANAARYVRSGGVLLYATCTVLPEENEGVTEEFLRSHSDFVKEPFSVAGEETDGSLTLWPQRHDTDGFYLCKMRKV